MGVLQKAEETIGGLFKGLPKMSESSRESLAKAWPWLALIFGVLQLAAGYWLWKLTRAVEVLNDFVNSLSQYYTGTNVGISSFDKTLIYVGAAVLVVEGAIFLIAFPKLQKRERKGWDWLFLAAMLNLVYSVIAIFINGRGFGNFLVNLLGSGVAFYLLFQVKDKFSKA